jgi:hypothetical protein
MKNSIDLKGNKRNILIENESALNMEDVFMVKEDNSSATKSRHFYLSLTKIFNIYQIQSLAKLN